MDNTKGVSQLSANNNYHIFDGNITNYNSINYNLWLYVEKEIYKRVRWLLEWQEKGNHSFHYQQRMKEKGNTKKTERTQWQRGKERKKFETPFFFCLSCKDKPKKIIIYLLSQLNLLPFHSYIRSHIYIYISHSPPHLL